MNDEAKGQMRFSRFKNSNVPREVLNVLKNYVMPTSTSQLSRLPLDIVRAGDHCERRMSRQIDPFELMFG